MMRMSIGVMICLGGVGIFAADGDGALKALINNQVVDCPTFLLHPCVVKVEAKVGAYNETRSDRRCFTNGAY
jgi:hypothetical protein